VARALARREGLLVGGSSGTAVAAALKYARRLTSKDIVVAMCPDTGRNYLSKFYDDDWLAANHLQCAETKAQTVGDLLKERGPRTLVTVNPDSTAASASELMQTRGISQLPVLRDGRPVGSIQEVTLARLLHDDLDPEAVRVGDVMAKPLPQVDVSVQLDEAYRLLLAGNSGVLAVAGDTVVDIVTRIDLIQYWTRRRNGSVAPPSVSAEGGSRSA
jgi:cystathionine beta-synthase